MFWDDKRRTLGSILGDEKKPEAPVVQEDKDEPLRALAQEEHEAKEAQDWQGVVNARRAMHLHLSAEQSMDPDRDGD